MGKARMRRATAGILVIATLLAMMEPALARVRMSFAPGRHGYAVSYRHRSYRPAYHGWRGRHRASAVSRHAPVRTRAGRSSGPDEAPSAAPPPGSGFKMEDGVLTYPAPARFQPKNLKHL